MSLRKAVVLTTAFLLLIARAQGARAIDFYEIQIYPTETLPLGHLQLELHSNSVTTASGREAHRQLNPSQIHETIEATYGLFSWAEIGQYFATARLSDGDYEYAGSRTKFHFGVPLIDWPLSLGGNIELDYMRRAAQETPFTLEVRPIVESRLGKFILIADFTFEKPFSGPGTHNGVTFAPSGEVEYAGLFWWVSPALEYYGDIGAVGDLPAVQHQQHFIVPALNFDFVDRLELNVGVGFGLTRASNGTLVKTIVGWTF